MSLAELRRQIGVEQGVEPVTGTEPTPIAEEAAGGPVMHDRVIAASREVCTPDDLLPTGYPVLTRDPRPDLGEQGKYEAILAGAQGPLRETLHGLRCLGLRIQWTGTKWVLRMPEDEMPANEWAELRAKHLAPRGDEVRELLRCLRAPKEGGEG